MGETTINQIYTFGSKNKINTAVSRVTIDELYMVDTVFAMSTAKHGIFVSKIDDKEYKQSPLLNTIQDWFKKEVLKEKQES